MSGHEFLFPPPPPPPPPLATPNFPQNSQNTSFRGRGNRGNRGFRGRGQSGDTRGFRAGYNGSSGSHIYQRNDSQISNSGSLPLQGSNHTNNQGSGYPLPNYPPVQQPQYPESPQNGYGQQPQSYSPAGVTPASGGTFYGAPQRPQYYDGNLHNTAYSHNPPTYNAARLQEPYNYDARLSRANNPVQPMTVGPPIRMGFDTNQQGPYQQATFQPQRYPQQHQGRSNTYPHDRIDTRSPLQQNSSSNFRSNRRDSPNIFSGNRNRGQKRGHQDAFGEARLSASKANFKTQVAPAVPSFGIPLPVKPPAPETRKPKKKKRRHNQLGLTPKSLEHESSEEDENEIDEEAKLAAEADLSNSGLQQLKFTYNGQTSLLQSSSEIEVWIAERKRRFPTKARLEEKKRQVMEMHEINRAAKQHKDADGKAYGEAKERRKPDAKADTKVDVKARRKEEAKAKRKEQAKGRLGGEVKEKQDILKEKEASKASDSVATKAKLKMEKLRKQLEKEEKRVARAEAKVAKLKAEANNYAGVIEKTSCETSEDIKRPESLEMDKGLKHDHQMDVKVEIVNSINIDETALVNHKDSNMVQSELVNLGNEDGERIHLEDTALEVSSKMPDPLTPTSQPSQMGVTEPGSERDLSSAVAQPVKQETNDPLSIEPNVDQLVNRFDLATDTSPVSSADPTSSSSSSSISISTDSEEDASSGDSSSSASSSAPESRPSKRTQPEKVAPPKRAQMKTICRNFLQSGRCKKGRTCRFRHELPERGNLAEIQRKQQRQARREGKKQRVGLYQRLVEQEKQTEQQERARAEDEQQQQQQQQP